MLLVFLIVFSAPVISWIESIGGRWASERGVEWVLGPGGEPKAPVISWIESIGGKW